MAIMRILYLHFGVGHSLILGVTWRGRNFVLESERTLRCHVCANVVSLNPTLNKNCGDYEDSILAFCCGTQFGTRGDMAVAAVWYHTREHLAVSCCMGIL